MKKLVIAIVSILTVGCTSTEAVKNGEMENTQVALTSMACNFPDAPKSQAPKWVCDEKVSGLEVQAMGVSENRKAGFSHQRQLALMDAQSNLAAQLKSIVDSSIKRFSGTKGLSDSANVASISEASQNLVIKLDVVGAEIYQSTTSENGGYYMLIGLDKDAIKSYVAKVVTQSVETNNELWQPVSKGISKDQLAEDIASFSVSQ